MLCAYFMERLTAGAIAERRRRAAMIERVRSLPAKQWQHCQVDQAIRLESP